MNLTTIQRKIVFISSIVGGISIIGGSTFQAYSWVDNTIATKQDLNIKFVELRLLMIDESIARYHTIGLENLNDSDNHRYQKLLLAEQANEKQRRELLGL